MYQVSEMGSVTCRLQAVVEMSLRSRGVVPWSLWEILDFEKTLDFEQFEPMDGPIEFMLGDWLFGPGVFDP